MVLSKKANWAHLGVCCQENAEHTYEVLPDDLDEEKENGCGFGAFDLDFGFSVFGYKFCFTSLVIGLLCSVWLLWYDWLGCVLGRRDVSSTLPAGLGDVCCQRWP